MALLISLLDKVAWKSWKSTFSFVCVCVSCFRTFSQGKPPTKKAKVLHKAAWSAKIGAFLHIQGTGQLADGTSTGQDGK